MRGGRLRGWGLLAAAFVVAASAKGQTREAVQTKRQDPVYPEKSEGQGNVLMSGRIDKQGRLGDLHLLAASAKEFIKPAADAVKAWEFRPAMRDGIPIEVPANIGVRFRIPGEKRGLIPAPILGDLAIFPADESGKRTAPEGFPIRRGQDRALRAEAHLDVPPNLNARTLSVRVEAVAPSGRHVAIFQPPVAVPARVMEVTIPVVARIGADWEEGVWMLRFTVNGNGAGSGQFWLASDPAHFTFVIPKS